MAIKAGQTTIYGLCESNGLVRYVGKAIDPHVRWKYHMSPASIARWKSHKNSWIKSQLAKGYVPKYTVLAVVPDEIASETEIRIIQEFRDMGYDLTNGTLGGEGNRIHPNVKAKMSATHKARCTSPEVREQMRQSALKAGNTPPVNKGSKNGFSKLTEEDVAEIKTELARGTMGTVLAKRFNVTPASISLIHTGKTWGHVPEKESLSWL